MTQTRFEKICVVIGYLLAPVCFILMIWIALDTAINYYLIHSWVKQAIQTENLKFLYDRISTGSWWMFGRVWVPDIRAFHVLFAVFIYMIGPLFVLNVCADIFKNVKHANWYASAIVFVIIASPLITLTYGASSGHISPNISEANRYRQPITKIANQQVQKYKMNHIDHANEFQRIDGTTFRVNGTAYHVKDKNNIIMNYHHQPMASRQITVEWTQYNHVPKYLKAFSSKDLPSSADDNNSLKVIIDQ